MERERRYAPIQPLTDKGKKEQNFGEDPGPSEGSKRIRVGVGVACDECRRKKIRCNGKRPKCSNCQNSSSAITCRYRDEVPMSRESSRLLVEVVQTLGTLPADHATALLRELGTATNGYIIMSRIRECAGSWVPPAVPGTLAAMDPFAYEWMAMQQMEQMEPLPHATFPPTTSYDGEHVQREALNRVEPVGLSDTNEAGNDELDASLCCDLPLNVFDHYTM